MLLSYLLEHNRYLNIVGIIFILAVAIACSKNRKAIDFKLILHALGLQFLIALAVLKTSLGQSLLAAISSGIARIYQFADQGSSFVFGQLVDADGPWKFIFAIKVLPVIIFFGALMALLFYWGIVQKLVLAVNWLVQPLLGTTGAETLCAIANSFLGQTEAPLLVRDYLRVMSKSELFVVMVSGMGTISGAILVVFAAMGVPAPHLLTASVMAIPATIMIAKILLPEEKKDTTAEPITVVMKSSAGNMFDAIAAGTLDGLSLALNVGAMLIAFIALIGLFNAVLHYGSDMVNALLETLQIAWRMPNLDLQLILSYLFAPFALLLGFTGQMALDVGGLLGTKVAINELIAYERMVAMHLPERVVDIVTYALCGFSNFSCIGIQIGGIGALIPERRGWLTELGVYAVFAGSLSNLLSAMIASLLL
jgi:CNT family concentrative nucleoside transporter